MPLHLLPHQLGQSELILRFCSTPGEGGFSLFCWTWTWNCVNWQLLQSSCHPTRNPRKEEGRERQSWRWKESDPEVTVQPWARCFCSQSYVPTEPIIWVQYILYIYIYITFVLYIYFLIPFKLCLFLIIQRYHNSNSQYNLNFILQPHMCTQSQI